MLEIHLKTSKTDQLRRGADVYDGRTDCPLCPITAVLHFMALRGSIAGSFFIFNDGTPLINSTLMARVQELPQSLGYLEENFAFA